MVRWLVPYVVVVVVVVVACDAGAPPKPAPKAEPVPVPVAKAQIATVPDAWATPPVPPRHEHAVRTADLAKPDLGKVELPNHGIVLKSWGLGGDDTLILDSDAGTIRELSNPMGKPPGDHRLIVTPSLIKRTMAAANAAWDEDPNGAMPTATDVREDLYVLDGDEAFYLTGSPIGAYGTQGRPAAARALAMMFALAPNR